MIRTASDIEERQIEREMRLRAVTEAMVAPFVPPSMAKDLREARIETRWNEVAPLPPVITKEMTASAVLRDMEGVNTVLRAEVERVTGLMSETISKMAEQCAERGDPMVAYRTEMDGNTMRITPVTQSQLEP